MKIEISGQDKIPVKAGGVGLFFEDINYSLDGGLYAELLENRNFEAKKAGGSRGCFTVVPDGGYGWYPYPSGAEVALKIKTDRALFPENPHYMRISTVKCNTGVKNKAYDGVYLTKGTEYKISFYLRSYDYKGTVRAGVYQNGVPLLEKKFKVKADGKWHRYFAKKKAKKDGEAAEFAFTLANCGTVHADCFSLIPADAVLGVFRRDLVRLMKDLKPGFLRFPGGCVAEGNELSNRYLWKESVGSVERRRHNWNRWACSSQGDEDFSHYGQTLGVGFYEYFRLAEYLGAKPLPVLSVGIACQFMSSEFVPLEDPALESYIQDALDLVEFANGGADTMWGRLRADLGHPEPFGLEYLGLGNEQWDDASEGDTADKGASNEFKRRFELFEERIHARFPEVKIIGTVGPGVGTKIHADAWQWIRERLAEDPGFVYASDEHFYVSPEWLYSHADMYDGYPRGPLVFAGEYAAHLPGLGGLPNAPQTNNWESALAEAAFMTGMERNSDVVVMKCYAPLFGRLGYAQWSPDLIWFNGKTAYATPNYHVQKLYSLYTGDFALKTSSASAKLYASATERDGLLFVKAVNASEEETEVEVCADFPLGGLTQIILMKGDLSDCNSPEEPDKVAPVGVAPLAPHTAVLPPHSFAVLVFRK